MDIFLQVLQNFQNTAAFKTIFKNTILMSKSEHMLRQTTSFENCIYIFSLSQFNFIFRTELSTAGKVGPGRRKRDLGTPDLETSSKCKVGYRDPLRFKSGTQGPPSRPPSKFRSRTHIKVFFHCFTYYILYEELRNFFKEILFYEQSPSHTLCSELIHYFLENFKF